MGTSLIASAPPTTARSISPSAMASAALVMACRLVAQARTTEYASRFLGSPAARPTSRAMFGSCTDGITVPKTIWSMARTGISARCTSSATTCLPSSNAERSLKEVPALTNGVRRPATIATRRPGREAMDSSGVARHNGANAPSQASAKRSARPPRPAWPSACSRLLIAQLEQVIPGEDAGGVPVGPLDLHRVAPHLVHALRLHVCLHLRLAHRAPAAPFLDAPGAGAVRAQPPGRELRLPPVVPADEQVALAVEGQVRGLGLRLFWLELVE